MKVIKDYIVPADFSVLNDCIYFKEGYHIKKIATEKVFSFDVKHPFALEKVDEEFIYYRTSEEFIISDLDFKIIESYNLSI